MLYSQLRVVNLLCVMCFRSFGILESGRSRGSCDLKLPFECSLRQRYADDFLLLSKKIHMESNDSRGALIVLEGLDRCGKTLQCSRLVSNLGELGHSVESWRFPDRNTGVGQMISSYLANESQLDDRSMHLLFFANRWEKRSLMESKLRDKTMLIVDQYSYSGVAFSSARLLVLDRCKVEDTAPDVRLLAPDLVLYLDISPEEAAKRGGCGDERYEQLEFQKKVALTYRTLSDATWKIIDATFQLKMLRNKSDIVFLNVY